jgi:predicted ester cyclase
LCIWVLLLVGVSTSASSSAQGTVMTEEERNLRVVKAYWEAFNRGDVPAALASFSDPVLNNGREVPRAFIGKIFEDLRVRTPDISFKTEEIVAI